MTYYSNSPDILDLIINPADSDWIETGQLQTPFGLDDRQVASYRGNLIGIQVNANQYYEGHNILTKDRLVFSLLPTANGLSGIEIPALDIFLDSLMEITSQRTKDWVLVCERDCDQEPLTRLNSASERASTEIKALVEFCQSGGICPNFIIENKG